MINNETIEHLYISARYDFLDFKQSHVLTLGRFVFAWREHPFIGANPLEDFVRRIAKYDTRFKAAEPTLHEPTRSRVMRRAAYVHMRA